MNRTDYLKSFFTELERLKPRSACDLSHAIACEKDDLYVLLTVGDARAKLHFTEVDANPIRMAAAVMAMWKSVRGSNYPVD